MTTRGAALPGVAHRQVIVTFACLVAAWTVATVATTGLAQDVLVAAASLVPTVAVALVLRARTLAEPRPWQLVLVGLLLLDVHNTVWVVEKHLLEIPTSSSLPSALLLPLGYLLIAAGGAVMLRHAARHDTGTILDAAITAVSFSLLAWVLLISPLLADDVPTASRVRTMATLVVLAGVGGALYRAAALVPQRRASWSYALVAILATLAGTLARDLTITAATPNGAAWVGHLWVVSYLALAAAVAHPSAASVVPVRGEPGQLSSRRIWVLGVALAVGPGVQLLDAVLHLGADPVFIASVNLGIVPMVVLRISWLARLHADAERRLEHLADHDALTGLPNRRALTRHLERLLPRVAAGEIPGAVVLFADLDDFKTVNDTFGHQVGDDLLRAVAQRLQSSVRTDGGDSRRGDVVARFAGDEFVVVIEGDPRLATSALSRLEASLVDDLALGSHVLPARASVGVTSVAAGTRMTVDEVLSAADARMYEKKREHRAAADGDALTKGAVVVR